MPAIVLTDDVLNGLLGGPNASSIPCLQFLKSSPANKPCNCGNKVDLQRQVDGEHVRICVFQLPPERQAELKGQLGADQLILYMLTPGFPRRVVI